MDEFDYEDFEDDYEVEDEDEESVYICGECESEEVDESGYGTFDCPYCDEGTVHEQ